MARGYYPLLLHHDLARFSDGFDWGNGCTPGALQLAVALLKDLGLPDDQVLQCHEQFAKLVVADIGEHKWKMSEDEMLSIVDAILIQSQPT